MSNEPAKIAWRAWERATFEEARAQEKPILLSISAVWCHWCHVMDRTTYADDAVADAINERFIPVRVDNDRRPDVNARYNMGGWPTTVALAPDGSILTGGTYIPAPQMLRLLREVSDFYAENRDQIAQRAAELLARRPPHTAPPDAGEFTARIPESIVAQLERAYDAEYGGFGMEPKFPQTETLELLLLEYRSGGGAHLYEMAARTMLGMASGGTYDHVEGGFFRYSTTRDWSVPHFEKMCEDHGGLLRVLATLMRSGKNPQFRSTLLSALGYLRTVLYDEATGFFGGSQDADEAYYALPLEERKAMQAPYVDRTVYANWNANLASGLLAAAAVLEDEALTALAVRTLDALHERMRADDGLLLHAMSPGKAPEIRGLLTDQAAYLRALLDAHEVTGEIRFFERALALRDALATLASPGAGYFDRTPEDELGNLVYRDRPLNDNALVADSLLRIAALAEDDEPRTQARSILGIYVQTYAQAGSFAAGYARAVRRLLQPPVLVKISGAGAQADAMREAARALPDPFVSIRTLDTPNAAPEALLCRGTVCAQPVQSAAAIRAAYESLTS